MSYPFGMSLYGILPSEYVMDTAVFNFPELKLIMSNAYSLNPYSGLVIKRYDIMDPAARTEYEQELRAFFRSLPVDPEKRASYKQELEKLWQVD